MNDIKELTTKYAVHIVLVLIIIATYMYMSNVNKQNKKYYKKKYTALKQKIIQNKMKQEQQKYMKELDSISDDSYMMNANVPQEAYEPQGIESDVASSHSDTIDSHNGEPREISILQKNYPQELSRKQQY